jgi:hypothetical protein
MTRELLSLVPTIVAGLITVGLVFSAAQKARWTATGLSRIAFFALVTLVAATSLFEKS